MVVGKTSTIKMNDNLPKLMTNDNRVSRKKHCFYLIFENF